MVVCLPLRVPFHTTVPGWYAWVKTGLVYPPEIVAGLMIVGSIEGDNKSTNSWQSLHTTEAIY